MGVSAWRFQPQATSYGRYYDPALGRFLQPDPVVPGTGSQSLNRFSYAFNNPIRLTDPSGHVAILDDRTPGGGGNSPAWIYEHQDDYFGLDMQARDRVSHAWYEANPGYSTEKDEVLNDPNYASYAWPDAQGLASTINNDRAGFYTKEAARAAARGQAPIKSIQSAAIALGPAAIAIIGDFINGKRNSLYDVIASTPVGRKGAHIRVNPGTNAPASIGGRDYSGHALDRMQERGIPPSAVENTIQNGQRMPGNTSGETLHYDPTNNISVVTNTQSGRVVTVRYGPP